MVQSYADTIEANLPSRKDLPHFNEAYSGPQKGIKDSEKDGPDVRNCEPQNERPNHAQYELQVAVNDICIHVRLAR